MSNERDELAKILGRDDLYNDSGCCDWIVVDSAAEAILAAGYRKPRTITTAEELDAAIAAAFEDGSYLIVTDDWGRPWIIWSDEDGVEVVSSWPQEDDPEALTLTDVALPVTILNTLPVAVIYDEAVAR